MNRDFKFRAFNHVAKQMYYETKLGDVFKWHNEGQVQSIMIFSGILDAEKNEIYESDIITYSDGRKFIVEWNDKMAGLWAREVKHYDNGPHGYGFEETENYEWQIIGNVYVNPELLGK
jgi:hypothetical protein